MNRKLTNQLALVATTTLLSGAALADVFSEAAKLGANTGAMAYCGDNFADDDDKGRYKMIRLKLLGEFGDLARSWTRIAARVCGRPFTSSTDGHNEATGAQAPHCRARLLRTPRRQKSKRRPLHRCARSPAGS
jgi:hypothetical protein